MMLKDPIFYTFHCDGELLCKEYYYQLVDAVHFARSRIKNGVKSFRISVRDHDIYQYKGNGEQVKFLGACSNIANQW